MTGESALDAGELAVLAEGRHGDPFALLGLRPDGEGRLRIAAFLPQATRVWLIEKAHGTCLSELARLHPAGIFGARVPRRRKLFRYHFRWSDAAGNSVETEDPYRFGLLLSDVDCWHLAEGTHQRPYEVLGGHPANPEGVPGVRFAVWAPNARRVSVVGDWNGWDGRVAPMRRRVECGVWELFVPGVHAGERYKYEIISVSGERLLKADPYAFAAELRPRDASIVAPLPPCRALPSLRQEANGRDRPVAVYEVHAASWRRPDGRIPSWRELGATLLPYVADLGFTHMELLPIMEHPFDGSWGYQTTGLFAPTARHGDAEEFKAFVTAAQAAGLGVILDWSPAHFPTDAFGLAQFDGTALYEYADPREGFHRDWNSAIYNYSRNEVRNFLLGSALYWLERFGVDGLRVDAVASMLYRDYSRAAGEWIPNQEGGRENLEAISLIKRINEVIGRECLGAITIAEESTAFPGVSRPTSTGGLGFHYKWNMGWMHDTLRYWRHDPVHRRHHHNELTFSLLYAFSENFMLPFSHDEVVHGKGSLIGKMPGDPWQRYANLRALFAYQYAHPGKKLLFMGGEFAQEREWDHDRELDWHLLERPAHAGVQRLLRDLNRLYRETPALYQLDCEAPGFAWAVVDDSAHSVFAFFRRARDSAQHLLVVMNLTPVPRRRYRIGVPHLRYREVLNTDSHFYGGSNIGNAGEVLADSIPAQGQPQSIGIELPPLAVLFLLPV